MRHYLAHKYNGRTWYSGYKLLTPKQCYTVIDSLLQSNVELHKSVQTYDDAGNVVSTPLYADFDGEGCISSVVKLVNLLESEFAITPHIYFSGNRGFHVIVDCVIEHSFPHLVVEKFFEEMLSGDAFLDTQLYASKHLMRVDGSINLKSRLYKTGVTKYELSNGIEYVRQIAKTQTPNRVPVARQDYTKLIRYLETVKARVDIEVEKSSTYEPRENEESLTLAITPCIEKLIEEIPVDGEWNTTLVLIARFFNAAGVDKLDAYEKLMEHEHWMDDQRHVAHVFNNVFKNESRFGCNREEILQRHCDIFCPFNQEDVWIK